ncbi:MAG: hypothetical protein AAGA45_05295 [Verrucomicrobiota bacterium]
MQLPALADRQLVLEHLDNLILADQSEWPEAINEIWAGELRSLIKLMSQRKLDHIKSGSLGVLLDQEFPNRILLCRANANRHIFPGLLTIDCGDQRPTQTVIMKPKGAMFTHRYETCINCATVRDTTINYRGEQMQDTSPKYIDGPFDRTIIQGLKAIAADWRTLYELRECTRRVNYVLTILAGEPLVVGDNVVQLHAS